jgi:hypothetical protein
MHCVSFIDNIEPRSMILYIWLSYTLEMQKLMLLYTFEWDKDE